VAATYFDDLSDIGWQVTIGLQYDLAVAVCPLPDVRSTAGGYRAFADEIDIIWAKPTACGWEG